MLAITNEFFCRLAVAAVLVAATFNWPTFVHGASPQESEAKQPIRYTLSFDQARNHYLDVEVRVPVEGIDECELMMATWTPGSYLIREYARNIDSIAAMTLQGEPLAIEKSKKNRWVVKCAGQPEVVVKYRLYCREMSVRTNFVDREFAVLNGAPTFVTWVDNLDRPHWVTVQLPNGWRQSVTALDHREGAGAGEYVARNFDHLVDSPILVGNPEVHTFTVGGIEHGLVNLGGNGLWDGDKASKDVAKIVAAQHRLWGTVPYKRYLFMNVIAESGGGLEHDESTLMMTSRWSFRNDEAYKRWLGLVSHEFFHVWNVRTMRPKALVDYDYENENYFRSLWIAEGITSYYDDLCLVRAGVVSENDYLKALAKQIESLQSTPGRLTQSLSDSSYDTWIKFYRQDEHSRNTQISYYVKGAVVGFLLDAKIRELTNNTKSLDDVMRQCYRQFSGPRGYSEPDFRRVASRVAGADLREWFEEHVDSAGELNYHQALAWLGLEFPTAKSEQGNKGAGQTEAPATDKKPQGENAAKTVQPWTGMRTRDEDGRLVVSSVQSESPAFEAGVNVDDEVIAINRFRVSGSNLERVLKQLGAKETVTVLIARRGELLDLQVTPTEKPKVLSKLAKVKKPSDAQKENLKDWLSSEAE